MKSNEIDIVVTVSVDLIKELQEARERILDLENQLANAKVQIGVLHSQNLTDAIDIVSDTEWMVEG